MKKNKETNMIAEKKFPKGKLAWLWENMEGRRLLFMAAIVGTVTYNVMQLVVPMFSRFESRAIP